MFYLCLEILLAALSLYLFSNRRNDSVCFKVSIVVLYLFLALRFGQGSDYFNYMDIHRLIGGSISDAIHNPLKVHSDIGFRLLCAVITDYNILIIVISAFEMYCLYRFINKFSEHCVFSLCLFFPVFYMVYYFSALRQGIALAIIIGFMFEALVNKRWVVYYACLLITVSFHTSSVVLGLLPLYLLVPDKYLYKLLLAGLCIGFGSLVLSGIGGQVTFKVLVTYFRNAIPLSAMAQRAFMLMLVLVAIHWNKEKLQDRVVWCTARMYFFGLTIYLCCFGAPLIASRLMALGEVALVVFFANILVPTKRINRIVASVLSCLMLFFTMKACDNALSQGQYFIQDDPINYHYISIFNSRDIYLYRGDIPERYRYIDEKLFKELNLLS